MAWLSGYNKRIKVTADHTKVGSNLSWFPLTIFLKSGDGDTTKIFDELGSNNLKMAITKSDGTTQLYVEIEQWDTTNKVGVLHCGRDGDTLSSSADTDYYIYYDSSHADNTDYVGVKNSTPAQSVWDSNFKAIYHMSDGADTSHIYDSTSNNNDGTKKAANEPIEADGKVAKAQDFDGSNDYITTADNASLDIINAITISVLVKPSSVSSLLEIINKRNLSIDEANYAFRLDSDEVSFYFYNGTWCIYKTSDGNLGVNNWYHLVATYDGTTCKIYKNGELLTGNWIWGSAKAMLADNNSLYIGSWTTYLFKGLIDEVRISNTSRSADWIKATYNSLNNSLLTYGAEETNANFFPFF